MNVLAEKFAGEKGERVKAPMRLTNSETFAAQIRCTARRSLGICKAQSGFTHSPHSPAGFYLTHVLKLAKTGTAGHRAGGL
jgi:hypothetical protein